MAALVRTPKFQVWTSNSVVRARRNEGHKSTETTSSVSVGGDRRVPVLDVANVAVLYYGIALDAQSLEKLDSDVAASEAAKAPRTFKLDLNVVPNNNDEVYPEALCRAALFARVVSLMQSRANVKTEVIQCMGRMLDANVIPNFTSRSAAGIELVATITGAGGYCLTNGGIFSTASALSAAGISPLKLSDEEAVTLMKGHFLTTGAACLVASGAANICTMTDCISSLSCDSFGAYMEPFDSVNFDVSRPHRGQITSANNLRLLLEGSKRTNTPPSDATPTALKTFSSIPLVNGPASETIQATIK